EDQRCKIAQKRISRRRYHKLRSIRMRREAVEKRKQRFLLQKILTAQSYQRHWSSIQFEDGDFEISKSRKPKK
ncbi:hypothetical protein ADUPG1_013104, partial [Aduncisulcus paluster]